jgi:hypothetical protein
MWCTILQSGRPSAAGKRKDSGGGGGQAGGKVHWEAGGKPELGQKVSRLNFCYREARRTVFGAGACAARGALAQGACRSQTGLEGEDCPISFQPRPLLVFLNPGMHTLRSRLSLTRPQQVSHSPLAHAPAAGVSRPLAPASGSLQPPSAAFDSTMQTWAH